MTKIIGLTGGIGSGKTTIGNYIRSIGIPVYVADDEARKITESEAVVEQIKDIFGDQVVGDGKLDRKALAQVVFNNPEQLQKLNSIVHPLVFEHFKKWVDAHKNEKLLVKEAAILFESGSDKDCDFTITVTAPIEDRIKRVQERDKIRKAEVLKRIENQWTDAQRLQKSDFHIENSDIDKAKSQTDKILKKLANL